MQNSCSAQKLHGLAAFITKEVPFKGAQSTLGGKCIVLPSIALDRRAPNTKGLHFTNAFQFVARVPPKNRDRLDVFSGVDSDC